MPQPRIAGFGFATVGSRPDLADLDRALGRIEEVGASHCELSLCGAFLVAGGRVLPEMRRRLETVCARRALRYTVHGYLGCNLMDAAHLELHEQVAAAMLELTAAVGGTVMVHHPGIVPMTSLVELERLHRQERDALRRLGDVAAGHGVRIAVETLFVESRELYTADPARLAQEIVAVDHPNVTGTLDLSHSHIQTSLIGHDFAAALAAFAPVTGHVHLHDSFGRPASLPRFYGLAERIAYGMGDIHLPFGWGDIAFETLLPGLPFQPGTAFIVELPEHFWTELGPCAEFARRLVDRCNAAA
jgi:sugar phosphate isomerase/epimerase